MVMSNPTRGDNRSEAELAARLRMAVTRLGRRLRKEVGDDVSPSQLAALATVGRLGPLTSGELSAAEGVRPPTMTKVVAALAELGLVDRTVDPGDRRVVKVSLTPLGTRFLEHSRRRKDAFLTARLRALDPHDRVVLDQAAAILERLVD